MRWVQLQPEYTAVVFHDVSAEVCPCRKLLLAVSTCGQTLYSMKSSVKEAGAIGHRCVVLCPVVSLDLGQRGESQVTLRA